MLVINKINVDLNKIDIPETLYKYRDWSNKFHKDILLKREVFYSSPDSFEDKYDCKIPIRYDLLRHEDLLNHFFKSSQNVNPHLTSDEHMDLAIEEANLYDYKYFEANDLKKLNSQIGVLSLTANPENIKMWEKYANNNTGFCVGFAGKSLHGALQCRCDKVTYHNELPIILPPPTQTYSEQESLQVFSKLIKWKEEEEYRSFFTSQKPLKNFDRIKKVPGFVYTEIIFGAKMSDMAIKKIIKNLPVELKNLSLKRAFIQEDNILIDYL